MDWLKNPEKLRERRTRMAAYGVLAVFLCLYAYVYGLRLIGSSFIDFPSFWVASKMAFGAGIAPYGGAFAASAAEWVEGYVHPFLYPPATLVLLAPLAWLPLDLAEIGMLALNFGLAIGIGWLLAGPHAAPVERVAVILFVMMAQSVRQTIGHGQVNLIVLFGALLALRHMSRQLLAGVVLGLSVLLKLYFTVLLAVLLLHRRWLALAGALGALGILSLAVLPFAPEGSWRAWGEMVLVPTAAEDGLAGKFLLGSERNISLTGVMLRAGVEDPIRYLVLIVIGLVTCGASLIARRLSRISLAEIGLFMVMVILVSPNSWVHYMVFALPAAVAVLQTAWRRRSWVFGAIGAACGLILIQSPGAALGVPPGDLLTGVALILWLTTLAIVLLREPPRTSQEIY